MKADQLNSSILNEVTTKKILVGLETTPGTFATPTVPWYGDLAITRGAKLSTKPERTRTRDQMRNPKAMPVTYTGTYSDDLAFQTFAEYLQYGIHPAPTPVGDGNSPEGYLATYEPSTVPPSTFSAEHGFEGIPFRATGLQFDEFTIGADIGNADGNWTFSGNLIVTEDVTRTPVAATATSGSTTTFVDSGASWTSNSEQGKFARIITAHDDNVGQVVQILSNTTTALTFTRTLPQAIASADTIEIMPLFTTGISDRTLNYIPCEGTRFYIADALSDLATPDPMTEIVDKFISFSVSYLNNTHSKRFLNNIGKNSPKLGYGSRVITFTAVMEFDDWEEYRNFESTTLTPRSLLVTNANGPAIDTSPATFHTVSIRIPSLYWNNMDPNNDREGNVIVNMDGYAYYNDTDGSTSTWSSLTTLSAVPA